MVYIYDILLNFNKELVEFFDWTSDDNIKYIRKIPLIKVKEKTICDVLKYDLLFYDEINKFESKSEFYDEYNDCNNVILLSDSKIVIGLNIKNNKIDMVSRLLLDEELEVLKLSDKIEEQVISYKILNPNNKQRSNNYLTKKEQFIKNELFKEFNSLYNLKKMEKLNYYYYEYYNKISNNKEVVYKSLIDTLENINEKHFYLYEIIKLSYHNKV